MHLSSRSRIMLELSRKRHGPERVPHSAISTQCNFGTEQTLRHTNTPKNKSFRHSFGRFDTLERNAYLCLFIGFHSMDSVLIDLKIP